MTLVRSRPLANMPRIRLKAGEQRVWLLYDPVWTVQAFKGEINRLLGIKQNFSLELDGEQREAR